MMHIILSCGRSLNKGHNFDHWVWHQGSVPAIPSTCRWQAQLLQHFLVRGSVTPKRYMHIIVNFFSEWRVYLFLYHINCEFYAANFPCVKMYCINYHKTITAKSNRNIFCIFGDCNIKSRGFVSCWDAWCVESSFQQNFTIFLQVTESRIIDVPSGHCDPFSGTIRKAASLSHLQCLVSIIDGAMRNVGYLPETHVKLNSRYRISCPIVSMLPYSLRNFNMIE